MEFKLMKITGLDDAIMSLKMSKRNWTYDAHIKTIDRVSRFTNQYGRVYIVSEYMRTQRGDALKYADMDELEFLESEYCDFLDDLDKLAKWGAGVENGEAYVGDGHETILRFIDLTFVTEGLHRGAQDDLDAHAARFNTRIVRSSTRLAKFEDLERSDWYRGKIRSTSEIMTRLKYDVPEEYTDEYGIDWVRTSNGYVRADLVQDKDVLRGNYPLSIPSNAIWKINLHDLRHVYMRRNIKTTASPELQEGIEQLADQVEEWLPCDLGKIVRYDWAKLPDGTYGFAHIHDIQKVANPR